MSRSSHMPMLVVLYAAAFISAFNENIVNVALVDIMSELGVSSVMAQWLVTGYMAITAVIVALMAFLMKRFTVRFLFFFAAGCFIVGEVTCMVAPSFPLLLSARLLQAIGSGTFIPLMMSAVLACAPREKLGTYLSLGSAAITLGPALAPVLSGAAVTAFGWRSIFAIPAASALVVALFGMPTVRNFGEQGPAKLDVLSLALAVIGLPLLVYGFSTISLEPALGAVACLAAIALLVTFSLRQERIGSPLLDMRPLLHNRSFALAAVLAVVAMMTTFSMSVLLPVYFEMSFGMSALVAGLLLLPAVTLNAGTAVVGGRVMDRVGPWPLLPIGFALIVIGQAFIAVMGGELAIVAVVAASVVVYAGVGLVMAPSQTAGLSTLSHDEHPSGVSIMNTLVMVAASFGPSLFVGIQEHAAGTVAGNGVPAEMSCAIGFSEAVMVAALIALAGLALSVLLAYSLRRQTSAHDEPDGHGAFPSDAVNEAQ